MINKIIILILLIILYLIPRFEHFITYKNFEYSDKLSINDIKNLHKGQKIMTKMFSEFDSICRKHNIKYWCVGGTLIGVLRHKGWISYDGDIDLGILECDYNKLKSIIQKELSDDYWFQSNETDKLYKSNIAKIRHLHSCYSNYDNDKWHNGLQIDLFIFKEESNYCYGENKKYEKNSIFPLKEKYFENIKVYIPNDSDKYIKMYYPDYKKIYPVEKRFPNEGKINPYNISKNMKDKYPQLYLKK